MDNEADIEAISFLALCDLGGVGYETLKKVAKDRIRFQSFFEPRTGTTNPHNAVDISGYARLTDYLNSSEAKRKAIDSGKQKFEYLRKRNIRVVFSHDTTYPAKLKDLQDYPRWLFVEGNMNAINLPSITAVGSRKVSAEGKWLATYFGFCLSQLNVATVSGLAEGVDQIVHRASLAAHLPTIAVLGTGILLNYPKGSEELRQRIVECGGAIVTEYLPNDTFSAKNFVRRNRIQAALGQIVFPIEWGIKSGTAHTVKFASDLRRPIVFVRTPTQDALDWIPKNLLNGSGRFTLPLDQEKFLSFLREQMNDEPAQKSFI